MNQIEINARLSSLDWIIFTIILLFTIAAITWGHFRKKNAIQTSSFLDHLLMGRQLTLPLFIATLVATWYGGIFGVTQIAFEKGIYMFITQGFFWYITYFIFAIFLVNKIHQSQAITLPDMVRKQFGVKSEKLAAILNIINVLPIAYIISIGIFLNLLFATDLWLGSLVGTLLVTSYSLLGGFRSVVFSDLVQFFVMISAVFFIVFFSYVRFGGMPFLTQNLPPAHFVWHGNQPLSQIIMWGLIALSTLVDPNFYQRCLAAKNAKIARNGIFLSTVVWIGFDLCTTFGALYARARFPELKSSEAYLYYGLEILPNGFRGFFLAGILATILSTLDSYLFIGSSTAAISLAKNSWQKNIRIHRLFLVGIALISYFVSLLFSGNIAKVWSTIGGLSASCLLLPMLLGISGVLKFKDHQFFGTSLSGIATILGYHALALIKELPPIESIYLGSLGCMLFIVFNWKRFR